jgi:hypothetical protein
LLEAIVHMRYDVLKETRLFSLMNHWVSEEQSFILNINGKPVLFANVNDLFYGTQAQLKCSGDCEQLRLITKALKKMEGEIAEIEMCASFSCMTMQKECAASLDSMLAKLTIM